MIYWTHISLKSRGYQEINEISNTFNTIQDSRTLQYPDENSSKISYIAKQSKVSQLNFSEISINSPYKNKKQGNIPIIIFI